MSLKAILNWIDRDLDHTRPWSVLLIAVPFIAMWLLEQAGGSQDLIDLARVLGVVVLIGFFPYVIWRMMRNAGRSVKDAKAFFDNSKIGGNGHG